MKIGVPKEIKNNEFRVGLTPPSVSDLCAQGHQVFIEKNAGIGIACSDSDYQNAGATILGDAQKVFESAETIVKVKEPQPQECKMLQPHHLLFTYLHLAADVQQTDLLLASGCTAIAYETVTDSMGKLPLLAPMSEVAGKMAVQVGAQALQKSHGGRGLLMGGVAGTEAAHTVILGAGVVGSSALKIAVGMGARVTVVDSYIPRLRQLDDLYGNQINTRVASKGTLNELLSDADMIVGAALVPGAEAPKLISRSDLKKMKPGAVLVDVSIDQGGCFETSRPTTHENPTYIVDDIVHYCVANIPGAVPRTSAFALNNAVLPYLTKIAADGWHQACSNDEGLKEGINIHQGKLYCAPVGLAQDKKAYSLAELF